MSFFQKENLINNYCYYVRPPPPIPAGFVPNNNYYYQPPQQSDFYYDNQMPGIMSRVTELQKVVATLLENIEKFDDLISKNEDKMAILESIFYKKSTKKNFLQKFMKNVDKKKALTKPDNNNNVVIKQEESLVKLEEVSISSTETVDIADKNRCKSCGKVFAHENELIPHEHSVHLNIRPFLCQWSSKDEPEFEGKCAYAAARKGTLVQHIKGVHLKLNKRSKELKPKNEASKASSIITTTLVDRDPHDWVRVDKELLSSRL